MSMIIKLRDYTNDSHPYGNKQGREVFSKLSSLIEDKSSEKIIGISLDGIDATDASFPRESVVTLMKIYVGEKGFYLVDLPSKDKDLLDNWDAAAKAKEQPIIVKTSKGYDLIGPEIISSDRDLLDYVMKEKIVTTSKVADTFKLSVQNASAKLKRLHIKGLIVGKKEAAESGGLEFIYAAIK
jgi:hypothetical protein